MGETFSPVSRCQNIQAAEPEWRERGRRKKEGYIEREKVVEGEERGRREGEERGGEREEMRGGERE